MIGYIYEGNAYEGYGDLCLKKLQNNIVYWVSFLQLATFMQLSTSGPKWGRNIQQKKSWTMIIMVGVQNTDEQVTARQ